MIKINEPSKELVSEYKKEIIPKIKGQIEKNKDNNEYGKILQKVENVLDKIIVFKIENLIKLYNNLQSEFPNEFKKIGKENKCTEKNKEFNSFIINIFDYNKLIANNQKLSYKIANSLNIPVCPYCNRIYTTTYDSKSGKTRPEFDHFFAKSLYPILSLSIYNLIPSCSICNRIKKNEEFSIDENIYPYNEGINNEKYFSYELKGVNTPYIVTKKSNKKMNSNSNLLKIEEIYRSAHNDIVQDIIMKSEMYNYFYIKELNELENIRKITKSELKYFLGYTNVEELEKVSLGKLKNDIIDEVILKR